MRFSEAFGVERTRDDDWFDPVLFADTKLFVDPFLIFLDREDSRWGAAHARLIAFFNLVLTLLARAGRSRTSAHHAAARRLMVFPEPAEFCLGYSEGTTRGTGAGRGLQHPMIAAAEDAIELGMRSVRHFEELTLFEPGIGADRISDIVCNVLKKHFIEYTQDVARVHDVPVAALPIKHADWSDDQRRWVDRRVELPINPYNGDPILLAPERFLRSLPTVDPEDFWDWAWENENENIRGDFNYEIGRHVDAYTIARFARANRRLIRRYIRFLEENPKSPYDLEQDPLLEVRWYEAGAQVAAQTPLRFVPDRPEDFCQFVQTIIECFVHNVEQQDGWILLWSNGNPRAERIAQALFRSAVIHYCRANNIDLTGESNAGRGPVDFKFSQGWNRRALVEVKLTNNSRYWHGIERQTPQYMRSEEIRCGFFLSIGFRPLDFEPARVERVRSVAAKVAAETGYEVTAVPVDAQRKAPASRS
jgi:hypothetical protein